MPYTIRKLRNSSCYSVKNSDTGRYHSKCTTLKKAKSQVRLLYGIDNGWKPTFKKSSKRHGGKQSKCHGGKKSKRNNKKKSSKRSHSKKH